MSIPRAHDRPRPEGVATLAGTLAERYRVEHEIGRGGMATVYLATDLTRDVTVAIKTPHPELVVQLGGERFAREIRIARQLQHPFIVPVLDVGTVGAVPFYVMPFVDGETLESRLRRDGPLPVDQAVNYACEIAEGLAYAHRLGFIHRDVKPSNVLLSNGHALLADFGIARAVESTGVSRLTESGFALGTADYMSPEQASGDSQLDGRSDVYSLACVLYEMLAGAPPFTGPTARSVMARHFVDPVPSLRTVRGTVPESLEAAIVTAMAKTPVDRFGGADAFRDALRESSRIPSAAMAARPRATSAPARGRWFMPAAAAAVIAVAATAVWQFRSPAAMALDRNRVMVYPFVLSGGLSATSNAGEDVATIIGNALDSAEPLRWVDGWALLDDRGRENIRTLSHEGARSIARGKHCATFVTGRLVGTGDSVMVALTLHDVAGDSVLAEGKAVGAASDPWKQGLSAVSGILPQLIPGSRRDVSAEWKEREPGAVANFLIGEAAFRRVHLREALDGYRKAIALDSTFAIAALRGAQAASWNHRGSEAGAMLRVALSQPLPPRYEQFALGLSSYLAGRSDSAVAHLRAAIAADSESVVSWMQLGETYVHLLPMAGNTDSLADAAFTRARLLDSAAANVLLHPIDIRLRRGDAAGAAPLVERFRAAAPDSALLASRTIAYDCVRAPATVDWLGVARSAPAALTLAASEMSGAGAALLCARRAFDALLAVDTTADDAADARRFTSVFGLLGLHLGAGNPAGAIAAVDAFQQRWGAGESLFMLAAPFHPQLLARAREVARRDSAAHGASYVALPYARRLWLLGVLEARTGRVEVAAAVAAELHRRDSTPATRYEHGLALSLDAFVRLARGDSVGAEHGFRELMAGPSLREILPWDEAEPRGGERLTLVQLLLARRQYDEAIAVADVFDAPKLAHGLYLRPSLELREQAAQRRGNAALASRYRDRLAALRSTP
ncbi:MAG TPA: serine/threonine-protein kinase [Gemmatimonadaceae bacterium]|nr:serine/threonine-protein kinase [Gemmatimonadaceae bacterium]